MDARYDEYYTITPEELKYLEERIVLLQQLVAQICEEKITELLQASKYVATLGYGHTQRAQHL